MSTSLVYVYRLKIKCPVCRRVDGGCSVTKDRKRVLCWKVPSDEVTVNGHYWHTWPAVSDALTEEQIKALASARAETHADLAPIEKRDAVYRLLIESCALEERERQDLIRRGYAPDRIPSYFKSLPPIAHASFVTTEISERIGDLAGVPGFFASRVTHCGPCSEDCFSDAQEHRAWSLNLSGWMAYQGGLLNPYMDVFGRIQAIQIRRNTKEKKNKYLWLSSANVDLEKHPDAILESRTKSESPAHYVNVERMRETGEAYIVEGGLKAEVSGYLSGEGTIGFGGLNAPPDFTLTLALELPEVRHFHVCMDADWRENKEVRRSVIRLTDELKAARLTVDIPVWNSAHGKGLDDLLLYQHEQREGRVA